MGLLERSAELAALRRRLAEVSKGSQGRLVLVRGEAGIGKTAPDWRLVPHRRALAALLGRAIAVREPARLAHHAEAAGDAAAVLRFAPAAAEHAGSVGGRTVRSRVNMRARCVC